VTAKRQTVLGLTAGAILAVAIGILGLLHATAFDPATVKAELERRIAELNAIPETDAIRKDGLAEELLANESYRQHARALYLKVERAHPKLHESAQLERAAQKEVPPFLAQCRDLSKVPPDELSRLWDECRSLLRNYDGTRYGKNLREARDRIQAAVEAQVRCTAKDVVDLQAEILKQVSAGRFALAWRLVDEFEKKYSNAGEFAGKLQPLRHSILQKAHAAKEKMLAEATSPEARRMVQERLDGPDFKGLPDLKRR